MTKSHLLTSQYNHAHVDFMASTVAFMERQKKTIDVCMVEAKIPSEHLDFFRKRLAHYRAIYTPQQ
ncbi:DNA polymerase III subunit theta [Sodalis sp. dw_96]|uniref:DNA polymerase III subunit theta n=1 Tax=Sodalis sp. dw_96 TaxID=2719794 RepID=UPI001BD1E6D1|nr:DNA polymerase III subunit theta [Sodalis sp. dw_96]